VQDDSFGHLSLRAGFLDGQQDHCRRRGHGHRRRSGRPCRHQANHCPGEEKDGGERQRDLAKRCPQQLAVVAQPAQIEAATDLEHQDSERRVGNRSDLGQGLDTDPAQHRGSEQRPGEDIADHLGPAERGAQPLADQQTDDQ
jgi:hypothetical protein